MADGGLMREGGVEGQLAALEVPAGSDAGEEFVRRASRELDNAYRLAGYLLGNAADAQDAVQDALIKAWLSEATLRDPARFGAWLDRIVLNVCRDRMRRHRAVRMVELDAAAEAESGDEFRQMLALDELASAVARLAPEHRIVIALRFWRDLPLEAIAERLDMPLGTVKSRLHYALRALRAELEETHGGR